MTRFFYRVFLGIIFAVFSFFENNVYAAGCGACMSLYSSATAATNNCSAWCNTQYPGCVDGTSCNGVNVSVASNAGSCVYSSLYCVCFSGTQADYWAPSCGSGVAGYPYFYFSSLSMPHIQTYTGLCGYVYGNWGAAGTGVEARTRNYYTDCTALSATVSEYRCAQNYYGTSSACTRCPGLATAAAAGGFTSQAGTTSVNSCWVYGGTGYSYEDATGVFNFTSSPCLYS